MELAVFILGALVCLAGAAGVITARNPVHAALSLVGTLFGIAILFIAQDAEFLAAVQIIVYAGAIVVLILFVIMLLGVERTDDIDVEPLGGQRTAAVAAGVVLFAGLLFVILAGEITGGTGSVAPVRDTLPNVNQVAEVIFTDYLFAFEITSVLLLIAVVGGVTLARHRKEAYVDDELPGDDLAPAAVETDASSSDTEEEVGS